MATERIEISQLILNPLPTLVQVVFDNIEEGRYYYVREREPGETPYDLYGRVSDKSGDRVVIDVLARRALNPDGSEGAWEDMDDETYVASRDLVNSWEQNMSSRYYLPLEGHSDAASAPVGGGFAAP
jgi:hypothetical protein